MAFARQASGMNGHARTYLVTGACGGLGAAVTDVLVSRGATVFAADCRRAVLNRWPPSRSVRPLLMDVTDAASITRARRAIQRSAAVLDGIICAAGIYTGGPLLDVADEELRRVLDVNVRGAAQVVRELMPLLRRGGTLVFVSSESTRVLMPFTGPYVISKRALEAYAETLRRELFPLGIRVTVIQPGAIRTPLLGSAAQSLKSDSARAVYRGALRSAEQVLLREMETGMDPARVAGVIARALERRRPRRRLRVGNNRLRAFIGFLPASWLDVFLRRFLGRP